MSKIVFTAVKDRTGVIHLLRGDPDTISASGGAFSCVGLFHRGNRQGRTADVIDLAALKIYFRYALIDNAAIPWFTHSEHSAITQTAITYAITFQGLVNVLGGA